MGTLARNGLAKCHIDINPVSANPTKWSRARDLDIVNKYDTLKNLFALTKTSYLSFQYSLDLESTW